MMSGYVGQIADREGVRQAAIDTIAAARLAGLEADALGEPVPLPVSTPDLDSPLWLLPVTGEATAYDGRDVPLHRQPRTLLTHIGSLRPSQDRQTPPSLAVAEFEDVAAEAEIADLVGSTRGLGVPVAFADGTVWLLRDTTPLRVLRPFLTRDQLARVERTDDLQPFRLREAER